MSSTQDSLKKIKALARQNVSEVVEDVTFDSRSSIIKQPLFLEAEWLILNWAYQLVPPSLQRNPLYAKTIEEIISMETRPLRPPMEIDDTSIVGAADDSAFEQFVKTQGLSDVVSRPNFGGMVESKSDTVGHSDAMTEGDLISTADVATDTAGQGLSVITEPRLTRRQRGVEMKDVFTTKQHRLSLVDGFVHNTDHVMIGSSARWTESRKYRKSPRRGNLLIVYDDGVDAASATSPSGKSSPRDKFSFKETSGHKKKKKAVADPTIQIQLDKEASLATKMGLLSGSVFDEISNFSLKKRAHTFVDRRKQATIDHDDICGDGEDKDKKLLNDSIRTLSKSCRRGQDLNMMTVEDTYTVLKSKYEAALEQQQALLMAANAGALCHTPSHRAGSTIVPRIAVGDGMSSHEYTNNESPNTRSANLNSLIYVGGEIGQKDDLLDKDNAMTTRMLARRRAAEKLQRQQDLERQVKTEDALKRIRDNQETFEKLEHERQAKLAVAANDDDDGPKNASAMHAAQGDDSDEEVVKAKTVYDSDNDESVSLNLDRRNSRGGGEERASPWDGRRKSPRKGMEMPASHDNDKSAPEEDIVFAEIDMAKANEALEQNSRHNRKGRRKATFSDAQSINEAESVTSPVMQPASSPYEVPQIDIKQKEPIGMQQPKDKTVRKLKQSWIKSKDDENDSKGPSSDGLQDSSQNGQSSVMGLLKRFQTKETPQPQASTGPKRETSSKIKSLSSQLEKSTAKKQPPSVDSSTMSSPLDSTDIPGPPPADVVLQSASQPAQQPDELLKLPTNLTAAGSGAKGKKNWRLAANTVAAVGGLKPT